MSEFIVTPTNPTLIETLFRSPITGRWTIPLLTFNTRIVNPYYGEIDILNDDYQYQKTVIEHFYIKLKEKWLYRDPNFRSLLKYFNVEKSGDKGTVSLIQDPDKTSDSPLNKEFKNHIFRYIEKYFVSRHYIDKVLRQYVATTKTKWYDLFHNNDSIKELFAHKLKKLIIATIYELQDKGDKE